MDYQTYIFLQAKGARWGDLECLDEEDIIIDLQKRHDEIEKVKAQRIINAKIKRRNAEYAITLEKTHTHTHTHEKYVRKPFKRDFSEKPKLPCCIGCKKYSIHSNPPAHFTEEDKQHCCAYCNVTGGKKHGGSCEKNS